jgi:hypothetical protein
MLNAMQELTQSDWQAFKEDLKAELRVELMALHLGDDRVISEEEAAGLLGLHPKTVAKMRRAGEIPAGYIGTSPRYTLGQIRALMRTVGNGRTLKTTI